MLTKPDIPVIYLAFANEQRGSANSFLRNLKVERESIRGIFADAQNDQECELLIDPDVTQDNIFHAFQASLTRNRIVIFHYGGHADSNELFVEMPEGGNEAFYSVGMGALFAQQTRLRLVFLNGCATREQADILLKSGVPVVIATSRKIRDDDATLFSRIFYQGIEGNATIARAFKEAQSALMAKRGDLDTFRGVFWEKDDTVAEDNTQLPWNLFCKDERYLDWSLRPDDTKGTGRTLVNVKTELIGKQVGSYTLTEFLSIGNFGYVFKAKHKTLDKWAAVKISHRIMKGYDALKEIVFTSNKGLSALNHPNIAAIEDVGEYAVDKYDIRIFVIMELVNGERLDKAGWNLQNGDSKTVRSYFPQILEIMEGLRSAHETVYQDDRGFNIMGVWHGNLKTRKIMLKEGNIPKIIDFMFTDLTRQKDIQLEYPEELAEALKSEQPEDYNSPEQLNEGKIDNLTDIFSLGAIFLELFTGKKVSEISFNSVTEVEKSIVSYNPKIPRTLAKIIFKAIRPNRKERYASMKEMVDDFMQSTTLWSRVLYFFGIRRF